MPGGWHNRGHGSRRYGRNHRSTTAGIPGDYPPAAGADRQVEGGECETPGADRRVEGGRMRNTGRGLSSWRGKAKGERRKIPPCRRARNIRTPAAAAQLPRQNSRASTRPRPRKPTARRWCGRACASKESNRCFLPSVGERPLRHARTPCTAWSLAELSFGTQSDSGRHFVEKKWTVIETCRQQAATFCLFAPCPPSPSGWPTSPFLAP